MSFFKGSKEYFPGIGQIKYEGPESKIRSHSNTMMLKKL